MKISPSWTLQSWEDSRHPQIWSCWFEYNETAEAEKRERGPSAPIDLDTLRLLWQIPFNDTINPDIILQPGTVDKIQNRYPYRGLVRVYTDNQVRRMYRPVMEVKHLRVTAPTLKEGVESIALLPTSARSKAVESLETPDPRSKAWRKAVQYGIGIYHGGKMLSQPSPREPKPGPVTWHETELLFYHERVEQGGPR